MSNLRKIFFIIGCARSGTTAVVKILKENTNSEIFTEQDPKLCAEARDLYRKKLDAPVEVLKKAKEAPIKSVTDKGLVYGDKNPNYLPFIPYLEKLWQPKYVFIVRDGRDTVRSLMDWHEVCRGNIFGMKEDEENSTMVSPEQDWWDYSRLRPNHGDPYFEEWKSISRFEKCCWYWNEFNTQILKYTASLDEKRWRLIDITKAKAKDFEEIFDFLEFDGFNYTKTEKMLASRINSSRDRGGLSNEFPHWALWTDEQMKIFYKHGVQMMKKLGYQ